MVEGCRGCVTISELATFGDGSIASMPQSRLDNLNFEA